MRRLSALLLASIALLYAAPGTARAADNGEWSVEPASSGTGRPYFYLFTGPGTMLTDRVTVTNKTARLMTFRLYAADAYNTVRDGGFAVRTRDEPRRGVGAWAKPARDRIKVPARSSVTVPYTLTVPETAEPGDHPGAIVALDERIAAGGPGTVAVGVQRAVAARVYLRVNGPTMPALTVDDLSVEHTRPLIPGTGTSRAVISYTLHNRGNVTLNPKVALKAEGLFGRTLLDRDLKKVPSELLPRQQVRLTEPWDGAPRLEWGEIELTAGARGTEESAAAAYIAVPWPAAAALLVIVSAGTGLWIRARRSRIRTS